jgi:hypothetical protein
MFNFEQALELTVDWYRAHHDGRDMRVFTLRQINDFLDRQGSSAAQLVSTPSV